LKIGGISAGLGTLSGNTPVVIRLTRDLIADSNSQDFPNGRDQAGLSDRIEVNYSGLPGSGNITAFCVLTYDAAGDELASNEQEQLIRRGFTTVTDGVAVFPTGGYLPKRDGSTNGSIWAWLWTNNGTANPAVVVRAVWLDEVQ